MRHHVEPAAADGDSPFALEGGVVHVELVAAAPDELRAQGVSVHEHVHVGVRGAHEAEALVADHGIVRKGQAGDLPVACTRGAAGHQRAARQHVVEGTRERPAVVEDGAGVHRDDGCLGPDIGPVAAGGRHKAQHAGRHLRAALVRLVFLRRDERARALLHELELAGERHAVVHEDVVRGHFHAQPAAAHGVRDGGLRLQHGRDPRHLQVVPVQVDERPGRHHERSESAPVAVRGQRDDSREPDRRARRHLARLQLYGRVARDLDHARRVACRLLRDEVDAVRAHFGGVRRGRRLVEREHRPVRGPDIKGKYLQPRREVRARGEVERNALGDDAPRLERARALVVKVCSGKKVVEAGDAVRVHGGDEVQQGRPVLVDVVVPDSGLREPVRRAVRLAGREDVHRRVARLEVRAERAQQRAVNRDVLAGIVEHHLVTLKRRVGNGRWVWSAVDVTFLSRLRGGERDGVIARRALHAADHRAPRLRGFRILVAHVRLHVRRGEEAGVDVLRARGLQVVDQVPVGLRLLRAAPVRARTGGEGTRADVSVKLLLHLVEHARLAVRIHHGDELPREDAVRDEFAPVDARRRIPVVLRDVGALRVAAEKPARARGGTQLGGELAHVLAVHEHMVVLVVEDDRPARAHKMSLSELYAGVHVALLHEAPVERDGVVTRGPRTGRAHAGDHVEVSAPGNRLHVLVVARERGVPRGDDPRVDVLRAA